MHIIARGKKSQKTSTHLLTQLQTHMVGIPIWVGGCVRNRYEQNNRNNRNKTKIKSTATTLAPVLTCVRTRANAGHPLTRLTTEATNSSRESQTFRAT